jgi:hypothetical protein
MDFSPLKHGIMRHFSGLDIVPSAHAVFVGTKPADDGWVMAVVRIDGCVDEAGAVRLGRRIRDDLLTHIRHLEGRWVPPDAVIAEHGVPAGGDDWSVAVYVTLGSNEQAEAMKQFLTAYAAPTAN